MKNPDFYSDDINREDVTSSLNNNSNSKDLYDLMQNKEKWNTFLDIYYESNSGSISYFNATVQMVFMEAVRLDDLDVIGLCVYQGADINYINSENDFPLNISMTLKTQDVMNYLIDKGADVNKYICNEVPLMKAIHLGNLHAVTKLLNSDANINLRNENGYSALHLAIQEKQQSIALYLIRGYPECINAVTNYSLTSVNIASSSGDATIISELLKYKIDTNLYNSSLENGFSQVPLFKLPTSAKSKNEAFINAVKEGNLYKVNELLNEDNSLISIKTDAGLTPLMLVCIYSHAELAKTLLNHVTTYDDLDSSGKEAYDYALESGNQRLIDVFVSHGKDLELLKEQMANVLEIRENTDFLSWIEEGNNSNIPIASEALQIYSRINKSYIRGELDQAFGEDQAGFIIHYMDLLLRNDTLEKAIAEITFANFQEVPTEAVHILLEHLKLFKSNGSISLVLRDLEKAPVGDYFPTVKGFLNIIGHGLSYEKSSELGRMLSFFDNTNGMGDLSDILCAFEDYSFPHDLY